MAQDFAKKFYNSKEWKACRAAYITVVHGLCERCKDPGLILHHIDKLTPGNINDPMITLNNDNLEYLCQTCHNGENGDAQVTAAGTYFNEQGQLVQKKQAG